MWRAMAFGLVLLAGCAAPAAEEAPADEPVPVADVPEDGPIPGDRPVAASFTWLETSDGGPLGGPGWGPREVNVTYHGVQTVRDEFARPTKALVFRVPEMLSFTDPMAGGLGVTRNEVHLIETQFEATDGRVLATIDLTDGRRQFEDPDVRHPVSRATLLSQVFHALGDDRTRLVRTRDRAEDDLFLQVEPYEGEAPLPGDCTMWQVSQRVDPPPADGETWGPRSIACLEETSLIPLWVHQELGGRKYTLERVSPGIALPALAGPPAPPVAYERGQWKLAASPLALPNPVLAPPRLDDGTWGQRIAERVAALQLDPGYQQYRASSGAAYTRLAVSGIDGGGLLTVLNMTLPPGEALDTWSVFFLTDGSHGYYGRVQSREGGPEQPDLHGPSPPGATFDDEGIPTDRLPDLVPDALLETQLAPLLPGRVDGVGFSVFAFADLPRPYATWGITQACTQEQEGWNVSIDAWTGALRAILRTDAASCGGGVP